MRLFRWVGGTALDEAPEGRIAARALVSFELYVRADG
jgi:hypothetical protein